jgi:hypothetical protein
MREKPSSGEFPYGANSEVTVNGAAVFKLYTGRRKNIPFLM